MKKSVLIGLVLSVFLMTGIAHAADKIVYVDLGRVFDGYKKTKEYDKVLEKQQKAYEKERDDKLEDFKKLQEKLSLLSEEERESQKGELETKVAKLQEFDRNATQDLRKQRDDKIKEIFKDINEVIEAYAKKEGITYVLDKRALVYQEKGAEITDKILKLINKK